VPGVVYQLLNAGSVNTPLNSWLDDGDPIASTN